MEKPSLFAIVSLAYFYCNLAQEMSGENMKPLGMQRPSEGHIEILETVPSPTEFFDQYLKPGKPAVFKNAAKNIPAFNLWTDAYLKSKFGNVVTDTEEGKKENRSLRTFRYSIGDFVDKYKTEDIYMVHSIPQQMRDEISLLPCMSCGGLDKVLQDVILWFSSGGTKSVLHNDGVDNINCLLSGTKDLYMVDRKYEEDAHIDVIKGGYSSVDVDAVNITKYPRFATLPWYSAHMEAGDCLFIPYRWLHQVRSFGRNIAVNIWFNHLMAIDRKDCETNQNKGSYIPLTNIPLQPMEGGRVILLALIEDSKKKQLTRKRLRRHLSEIGADLPRSQMNEVWSILDSDQDGMVVREEVVQLSYENLKKFNKNLPMYVKLGEEEDDDLPQDGEEEPLDGEEAPQDGEQDPQDGEQEPRNVEEEPLDGEEEPQDGEEEPQDQADEIEGKSEETRGKLNGRAAGKEDSQSSRDEL